MKYLFFAFILIFHISCDNNNLFYKKRTVAIQIFDEIDKKIIDSISKSIQNCYHFKVIILPKKQLYKKAYTNIKIPRYRADILIEELRNTIPDSIDYIIGITNKDISTTKRDRFGVVKKPALKYNDWGIMGLGYCPGKSCVVSTYRLKNSNQQLFIQRIQKVAIHEIGHNLNLPHCNQKNCVMNDANESIKTIDNANLSLCKKCALKHR